MDTENLRLFVAACEAGSLLKVAQRENLSTPTLTRKIQQLEEHLGTTLLKRGRRGVQPTPEGLLLLEKSMHLLGLVQKPQIDASDALAIAICHAHHRQSLIPHGLSGAKQRAGRLRL